MRKYRESKSPTVRLQTCSPPAIRARISAAMRRFLILVTTPRPGRNLSLGVPALSIVETSVTVCVIVMGERGGVAECLAGVETAGRQAPEVRSPK